MTQTKLRMPAEWEEQDGVLMAWPHAASDWGAHGPAAQQVTLDIAKAVTTAEHLLMVAPDIEEVKRYFLGSGLPLNRVRFYTAKTNDTWARDFGPITVFERTTPVILDFGFNGWGLKFPADLDNQITRILSRAGAFGDTRLETIGFILEGGSIETDGRGTILTTAQCLLSPNRNPHFSRQDIEAFLLGRLGAQRILWIENGCLAGDDTDGHIDTLARFCSHDTIVYSACNDPSDQHYEPLLLMAEELRAFRTPEGRPYRLVPLPWPPACYDDNGRRIPATYANFLLINGGVLAPTYGCDSDRAAIEIFRGLFPDRHVTGIDCLPLLVGGGSLHCVTMHIPRGVLA